MNRRALAIVAAATLVLSTVATPAGAQTDDTSPPGPDAHRLDTPLSGERASNDRAARTVLDPDLVGATGRELVSIRLSEPPVADEAARGGDAAAQNARRDAVEAQQDDVTSALQRQDTAATEVAAVSNALNAVFVDADVETLELLADDPRVLSISKVRHYELDLTDTVPHIGGTAVQDAGFDGSGVTVAVLDSGVDFTHAAFGGPGTTEFYDQCYGDDPFSGVWTPAEPHNAAPVGDCAAYFGPDAPKVVGGYDFVGELWPTFAATTTPDPNPIDLEGHGTHVADIIAGADGVAPGADIVALKVCSAVGTSCNGPALLQAIDFALDPDGDGDLSDRVDIINMSLGSPYGQAFDDDLSAAVDYATSVGVLTVASAGNSSDKPFITGSPAAAPTALSVAQTEVPSSVLPLLEVVAPAGFGPFAAVFQPWSPPLTELIEAPLQYGDGAGGNLDGCVSFPAGSLAGRVALVDRGGCDFTLKMANVSDGGAVAGIIGLIAPGEPFTGGAGTRVDEVTVPSFMISQSDSLTLKSLIADGLIVRFDPTTGLPLVQHMVGSSSRGSSMNGNLVKPEIGAPGASISAVSGSGAGTAPFGGTSGAAPMVAGSAALLVQAYPDRSPLELKSVMVNTGETEIMNAPAFFGGGLAPITRIGGGEVRVDRALAATAAAWVEADASAALSFGFHDVVRNGYRVTREVTVRNYSSERQMFDVSSSFRFDDDAASGAVSVRAIPPRVNVPPNGSRNVRVEVQIDPTKLPAWVLNSGAAGADGNALTAVEYDGYVHLTAPNGAIHMPWSVLPRAAGDVAVQGGGNNQRLVNRSVNDATLEAYHHVASLEQQPVGGPGEQNPTPDLRHVGYAGYPGGCGVDGDLFAFAVNTWGRQTHANAPALLSVFIDIDGDGTDDAEVFTGELGLLQGSAFSDGRNLTWVDNYAAPAAEAFFFTDHETNSANTVMYLCSSQLGAAAGELGEVTVRYEAYDLYFTGQVTDVSPSVTIDLQAAPPVFTDTGDNVTVLGRNERTRVSADGTTLVLVRGGAPDLGEALTIG